MSAKKKKKNVSVYAPRIRALSVKYFGTHREFAAALGLAEAQLGSFMNTARKPAADNLRKMFFSLREKGATIEELFQLLTGEDFE